MGDGRATEWEKEDAAHTYMHKLMQKKQTNKKKEWTNNGPNKEEKIAARMKTESSKTKNEMQEKPDRMNEEEKSNTRK